MAERLLGRRHLRGRVLRRHRVLRRQGRRALRLVVVDFRCSHISPFRGGISHGRVDAVARQSLAGHSSETDRARRVVQPGVEPDGLDREPQTEANSRSSIRCRRPTSSRRFAEYMCNIRNIRFALSGFSLDETILSTVVDGFPSQPPLPDRQRCRGLPAPGDRRRHFIQDGADPGHRQRRWRRREFRTDRGQHCDCRMTILRGRCTVAVQAFLGSLPGTARSAWRVCRDRRGPWRDQMYRVAIWSTAREIPRKKFPLVARSSENPAEQFA